MGQVRAQTLYAPHPGTGLELGSLQKSPNKSHLLPPAMNT